MTSPLTDFVRLITNRNRMFTYGLKKNRRKNPPLIANGNENQYHAGVLWFLFRLLSTGMVGPYTYYKKKKSLR